MRIKNDVLLHIYLFCYVFSFYIWVFPASMVIVIPLFICICLSKDWLREFLFVWGTKTICVSFMALLFISTVTFLITFMYKVYDFSLLLLLYTQIVHFICATFFFTFLRVKKISFDRLCEVFINIFVIQTFIELIASMIPPIGRVVRIFNHFDTKSVIGLGSRVRGYALSAATTYHLSLVYGVAFIIYIKSLIETQVITYKKIIQGCLIVCGVFFAGRTGFVGIGLGCIYYLFNMQTRYMQKLKAIGKVLFVILLASTFFLTIAPRKLRMMVVDNLIPYAFEFVYSKFDSGKAQTASTNQLKGMWRTDFDDYEIVMGSGKYTEASGRYYMHVDPGVLRHLLYGGIFFYALLVLYHAYLNFPLTNRKYKDYFMFYLFFVYFFLMDFKGVTLGINKFAFVTSLLLNFSYTYLHHEEKRKCRP